MSQFRRCWRMVAAAALALGGATQAQAQDETKRYSMGQINVGDRVEIRRPNDWTPCTVIGVRQLSTDATKADHYELRCDQGYPSGTIADSDHVRPASATAAPAPSWNVVDPAKVGPKGDNAYGARNPHVCGPVPADQLTPAVAVQAFVCGAEYESRNQLYLVENVSVRILGPSPYDPGTQTGFTNLDVSVPPYAIAGAFVRYQCDHQEANPKAWDYNYDRNCSGYIESAATGFCWKNMAGAWSCVMNDQSASQIAHVAPPR